MAVIDSLIDEYVEWMFTESPTAATFHGADGHDDRLPDLSAEGHVRREAAEDRWMDRFAALRDDELDSAQQIDRDLVLSQLRGSAITRDWRRWQRDPDSYVSAGLMGVFSLFVRRLHPEPELVRSAVARLRAVPDVLDQGRTNLDAGTASALLVRRALGQCNAAVVYSRDLLPAEVADDKGRREIADAGAAAATAYESFAGFLTDLANHAQGDWALGESRYSRLLREKELLRDDAPSLRDRGRAAHAALDMEMRELCRRNWKDDDWRTRLDLVNADRPDTPEAMREGYERWTFAARDFLVEHDLVPFPDGETCTVEPSPPFQRPVLAVASYFQPPAMRPSLAGRFNVPYPPEGTTDEELAQRLADNSFPSMPTTSVHEAYPGHHWHFAWMQANASTLRRLVTTPYFVEGWGLYTEVMMREQGFYTDAGQELCHLDARIFRAARIVADTSLHCGEMSFDEAVAYMHANTGLTEATARAEVMRYCAWPTQAASYLTGSLEIERMRDAWSTSGRGDLKGFHDRLAASGGLPIALAERALFA
ncbi:MAG TPA: DUF885 domain-containing protein [Acidimicrobiales bacterium]|nr:DUF885 domain-containing protein [Acidimicrobiales bacterium]